MLINYFVTTIQQSVYFIVRRYTPLLLAVQYLVKEYCTNKYSFLADSFILIFLFENSHYMEITPVFLSLARNSFFIGRNI